MSETVAEMFDEASEFEDLLDAAESEASTGWEMDFVSDMRDRFEEYQERMYLSERQIEILERIAKQ